MVLTLRPTIFAEVILDKKLPIELEVLALNSMLSYVISVLSDEQKQRLFNMVKSKPMEIPSEDATPEMMDYMSEMQERMRDTVKLGLGQG